MSAIILGVSVLLLIAGLAMIASAWIVAKGLRAGSQRGHSLIATGLLIYLITFAISWIMQRSYHPSALQADGMYIIRLVALASLGVSFLGWVSLLIVGFKGALERSHEDPSVDSVWKRIVLVLYWVSLLGILAAGWVQAWTDWYPWKPYLTRTHKAADAIIHMFVIVLLLTGWRVWLGLFTTGKVLKHPYATKQ